MTRARPAEQGVTESIGEQRPVGQAGQRVVEGPVLQLAFQRQAIRDVAVVDDDAANRGVLEEVLGDDLDRPPRADGMASPELARELGARQGRHVGHQLPNGFDVVGVDEPECLVVKTVGNPVAKDAFDGRALVGDRPVGPHDHDHVGRVLDE